MWCSLIRGTHHKSVMILASSVQEVWPKEGFHKAPLTGLSVQPVAVSFSLQIVFTIGYLYTKFQVSKPISHVS